MAVCGASQNGLRNSRNKPVEHELFHGRAF